MRGFYARMRHACLAAEALVMTRIDGFENGADRPVLRPISFHPWDHDDVLNPWDRSQIVDEFPIIEELVGGVVHEGEHLSVATSILEIARHIGEQLLLNITQLGRLTNE